MSSSLGTDTGGSVRQPAAFTGTIGLKPTYGLCSRYGMISYASSLDTVGIFARAVEDVAVALDTICGFDPNDSTSRITKFDYKFHDGLLDVRDLKGMKVGIPIEYYIKELDGETVSVWQRCIQLLKDSGAEVCYVSLPHTKYALPAYYVLAPAEASSNLARYDGVRYGHRSDNVKSLKEHYSASRTEGFGPEVKRRIIAGTFTLSVE
jgi:aspartyl-tRNA(Asn)/glutamyl-tRNA(Gln) amidotransferase subunit A